MNKFENEEGKFHQVLKGLHHMGIVAISLLFWFAAFGLANCAVAVLYMFIMSVVRFLGL